MAIDRREAMLSVVDSPGPQGYVPAAFFLHFAPEFHSGPAAVRKHEEFFRFTGMDFVKIQFELDFPQVAMERPSDWAAIPRLDKAFFAGQLGVVQGLADALGKEALTVLTLYSPFMIAAHIGGRETLDRHMKQDPEAVAHGLARLADDLLDFVNDCSKTGLDGFYHSTQGGEHGRFDDKRIFEQAIKPSDLRVMNEIGASFRLNILHICDYYRSIYGGYDDLSLFHGYPGHIVNCATEGSSPQAVSDRFDRPFMGGMDRNGALSSGTPEEAVHAARAALGSRSRRFLLGADCTVPGDTPWENLRAAIDEAHRSG